MTVTLEGTHQGIPDTGCEFHPSCLECPLVKCKEDMDASERYRLRTYTFNYRPIYEAYDRLRRDRPDLRPQALVNATAEEIGRPSRAIYKALERRREVLGV